MLNKRRGASQKIEGGPHGRVLLATPRKGSPTQGPVAFMVEMMGESIIISK